MMKEILSAKHILLILCFYVITFSCIAQANVIRDINRVETPSTALAPLRFLAPDELMGRATGRQEINIAARYISEAFRSMQLKERPNTTDYFQTFDIKSIMPATSGTLIIKDQAYQLTNNFYELIG